jgi:predicted CoA-binding protein
VTASPEVNDRTVIRRVLTTPATWAVVGLSTDTSRTAYGVARWMRDRLGHRIVPVHPRAVEVWSEPGYRRLADIPDGTTIDVVDCFVSSANVGRVVDQAVEQRDRLGIGTVWLQLGVVDHAAARRAVDAGLDVVMDTCPKIEYPHL